MKMMSYAQEEKSVILLCGFVKPRQKDITFKRALFFYHFYHSICFFARVIIETEIAEIARTVGRERMFEIFQIFAKKALVIVHMKIERILLPKCGLRFFNILLGNGAFAKLKLIICARVFAFLGNIYKQNITS